MKDEFGKCSECGLEMDSAIHQMRCVAPTLTDPRDFELSSLRARCERAERVVEAARKVKMAAEIPFPKHLEVSEFTYVVNTEHNAIKGLLEALAALDGAEKSNEEKETK